MKRAALSIFVLMVAVAALFGAVKATAQQQKEVALGSSVGALQKALWEKIVNAPKLSSSQRQSALKPVHESIAKRSFSPADEGLMILSMAVLLSWEKDVRYVALPYVRQAVLRMPQLSEDPRIVSVWNTFVGRFSDKAPSSDLTLTAMAALLDGPVLRGSSASRFHYFRGVSLIGEERWNDAIVLLSKVSFDSGDYRHAKFLEGTAYAALGKSSEAIAAFQVSVALDETQAEATSDYSLNNLQSLRELAVLQTARILYEQGRFEESLANYRTLRQDSALFYNSLAEQAWAFFMAGFPNRAMGAVYAASSPFYEDMYNPDIRLLDAVLSYWLCDYDQARTKLFKFIAHAKTDGDSLRNLVLRYKAFEGKESLTRFSRIAEDVALGVSPKNLGIGRRVITTAVRSSDVSRWLSALDGAVYTRSSFAKSGRYVQAKARIESALVEFETSIRFALGAAVRSNLQYLATETDIALMRARLLHLEVLMASKDLLVGKGRSVQGNEFTGDEKKFEDMEQELSRNWTQDKNEFWFDELGHYVFREKSKCASSVEK